MRKIIVFCLILFSVYCAGVFFIRDLLKSSLIGFQDFENTKVLMIGDRNQPEKRLFSFIATGHMYCSTEDLNYINNYILKNNIGYLFAGGDIAEGMKERPLWEIRKKAPYLVEAVPGNHDIYDEQSKRYFIKEWSNYRVFYKENTGFVFLNSQDCEPDQLESHSGCQMPDAQIDFITKTLTSIPAQIKNIVLFIHHIFWYRDLDFISKFKVSRFAKTRWKSLLDTSTSLSVKLKLIRNFALSWADFRQGAHDIRTKNQWWTRVHTQLKASGRNVLVFGGDNSFNSYLRKDGVHYFTSGLRCKHQDFSEKELQEFFEISVYNSNLSVTHRQFVRQ